MLSTAGLRRRRESAGHRHRKPAATAPLLDSTQIVYLYASVSAFSMAANTPSRPSRSASPYRTRERKAVAVMRAVVIASADKTKEVRGLGALSALRLYIWQSRVCCSPLNVDYPVLGLSGAKRRATFPSRPSYSRGLRSTKVKDQHKCSESLHRTFDHTGHCWACG